MIRKLRIKFFLMTMSALLIVFTVLFLILNIFMQNSSKKETERLLEYIALQDGMPKPERIHDGSGGNAVGIPRRMEMLRGGRFFYAKLDKAGNIFEMSLDMMFDITAEEAQETLYSSLKQGKEIGTVNNFQYLVKPKDYGEMVVFAETNTERGMLQHLIDISLWSAGCSIFVLLILSFFMSKWITKPVKTAFDRQQQFISDASHELKTPLTILSANVDVLENEMGSNNRLSQIKAQSERMKVLIHELLALARSDEGDNQLQFSVVDLSKLVLGSVLEFESRAYEEEKKFSYDVQDGIKYTGDEAKLKQVATIFIDNAIQHSEHGGEVRISLKAEGARILFSVYNTGIGVNEGERDKIFERFYRSDVSRARETGGYGLGLSIAKSIVDAHKGKITVDGEYGSWVSFCISL